jgi:enoyl-CoA hydratase/carnithine racemase
MTGNRTDVRAEHGDGILVLSLDDPSGLPRLTRAVLATLRKDLAAARAAAEIRGVVLTGTSKSFAVGAHVGELAALTPAEAFSFSSLGQALMDEIERLPKPVVAAIRGYCLGGGFDLAMACHVRVAATDAIFRSPGGSLGIFTGWGGTQRLPRIIGRARALELLITGRTVSGEEAHRIGLASRLVEPGEVLSAALALARAILNRAGGAVSSETPFGFPE